MFVLCVKLQTLSGQADVECRRKCIDHILLMDDVYWAKKKFLSKKSFHQQLYPKNPKNLKNQPGDQPEKKKYLFQ